MGRTEDEAYHRERMRVQDHEERKGRDSRGKEDKTKPKTMKKTGET